MSALNTALCQRFGVRYPIVQTAMGYVADAGLTAATANAGGMGILSAALCDVQQMSEAIVQVRALTDAPFGVNFRADQPDADDRITALIEADVPIVSFAMAPKAQLIERCKAAGITVLASIGARRHAQKVAAWGADAVIVQGGEGGGHTGGVPTSLLLPQVIDTLADTEVLVIGAGGYFDGRGLVAALAYGADGIAMGTRFLLTSDSPVAAAVKQYYLDRTVDDTVVTDAVDGVPQRVLRSAAVEGLAAGGPRRWLRSARSAADFGRLTGTSWAALVREGLGMHSSGARDWKQVAMAANAPMLYRRALLDGHTDAGVMATGQVVGLIEDLPSCAELIGRIVAEAEAILERLGSAKGASGVE